MFTLTISTDNAAFEDGAGPELARILAEFADDLPDVLPHERDGKLRDANGNTVGTWSLS